jgi:large subunit ribosomal protein L34e
MVQGKFKSGHYRKVQRRLPGGSTQQHYEERTPRQPHCAACGTVLHGIPRMSNVEAKNSPKTTKRPERPYGGMLCSACMRVKIVAEHQKRMMA